MGHSEYTAARPTDLHGTNASTAYSGTMAQRLLDGARTRPTAIDLFAGAGGLSLGLEQAGFDVLSAVEYDPVHALTHKFNFPRTDVLCADLSQTSVDDIRASAARGWNSHYGDGSWEGEVDLVAGGPPCQGFSFIGKRRVDDARNDLIFHFYRVVAGLRPKYFLMENVPGIASGEHRELVRDLIDRFIRVGYNVLEPQILNAAHYGVPQDRRRFILMGYRADVAPVVYPSPTTQPVRPVRGQVCSARVQGPTVSDAIRDLPPIEKFPELRTSDSVALTQAVRDAMAREASPYARLLAGLDEDISDFSWPRVWAREWLTSSAATRHTAPSTARFEATSPGTVERVSRFLRLDPAGLCNTLRAGTGAERGAHTSPRPIHPNYPRVITVREAARLHSFPDWFRFHVTKWHGFRQVGNAVPPLLGRALGKAYVEALGVAPGRPRAARELGDVSWLGVTMTSAMTLANADPRQAPAPRSRLHWKQEARGA